MMDKNNLGSFNSLQELWEAHPEGGHEGDYATVNGVVFRWNKYNRIWSGTGTPMETYGRKTDLHEGDVVINNDLTVAGMIRARGVKQPNKGLFHDLASLQKRYPFPEVGWWATVGDSVPGQIYRCDQPGVWSATGETGGLDSVDYEKITKIEQLLQEGYTFMGVATLETNPGTPDQKVFYIANGKGTYANFGVINVDEDEIVLLTFDTSWHKTLTGIASQAKLTELEGRTTNILHTPTLEEDDTIIITDNEDNVVATVNKDGCDFKNLKSNGTPVKAIPEILHDEIVGGESEQIWESNDGTEVYVKINKHGLSAKVFLDVPEFVVPSVVEPDDSIVDSGYSSQIGRGNVKRADWSATDKYLYYDFLAHYYDGYVNETSSYKATKRSLGSDASNMGYELFEYDFQPAKYSKVVMLSAGMNTCETGGIWGLATFIKALMTSNEEGFRFLRENVRFKVLPIICPASFDQATLKYENYNGVAINRNFDYKRSFYDIVWATKGDYPDSEAESRILKAWLNENAWKADLYIDCHQDPDKNASQVNDLTIVICSDSATNEKLKVCFPALVQFYRDKGYIPANITPNTYSWVETGANYPKTKYAKEICGIPSLMIEQYCSSTMYGSDGTTINDTFQIKQYVTVLRLYIFAVLAGNKAVKSLGELGNFIK